MNSQKLCVVYSCFMSHCKWSIEGMQYCNSANNSVYSESCGHFCLQCNFCPQGRQDYNFIITDCVGVVYSWLSKYSCTFAIELVSIHNVWKSMIQTIRSQLPKMDHYVYTGIRTVQLCCLWLWLILFFASCACFL
jgi:hypothetical protein